MSPHQYRQKQLYIKAMHMLLGARETVQEIAHQLGFEDEYYFSRFFKKASGKSPSHYRRAHESVTGKKRSCK
ncbi:helix-turn-helix domain-containing protein [Rubritalea tangerina]|uniref:helix-turn-helix domain-containing protein n=1 Tax=Rubritalea tangerina TaxID=430798 RepID=UPI003611EA68